MSDVSKHWDNEPDKHTLIKSEIASKYFSTWAAIIGRQTDHLTYLDLYAGRGKHDNGELSTAIKIVLRASKESILRKNLRILLNDKELDNIKDTKKVLADLDIEKEFLHKPIITNLTVDEFTPDLIGETGFSSTFCFIDPFGYKGLTVDLIRSVIKEWGCDCLIFFNFNRINLDLEKPNAERDMNLLFGSDNFSNIICQIKRYQKKGKV